MRFVDIIEHKRDGGVLSTAEIDAFVDGFAGGLVSDAQASAMTMAVFLRGMTLPEAAALTRAMARHGSVLDLAELPAPKADKHSTGGVGDKTSLVAAPLAAACGLVVPMTAGRALGHAGGTIDKVESIPGMRTRLSLAEIRAALRTVGACFASQTAEIAPSDRRLSLLRDLTATVESVPLLAASLMSRTLVDGLDALVVDVKTGDGAFTPGLDQARALGRMILDIGQGAGQNIAVLVTDMSQPLGRTVGNALEVEEAIETLKGRGPKDVESLSIELAAWMLSLSGLVGGLDQARAKVRDALMSGAGLRKLRQIIERQGGDSRVCDDPKLLPRARETDVVRASADGRVGRIRCRDVGRGTKLLGAGPDDAGSPVDPAVGVVLHKKVGELVIAGEPLLTMYFNDPARLAAARPSLESAIDLTAEAPRLVPLVCDVLR
jgi:pyrimidine-nucleoside phosphorylase